MKSLDTRTLEQGIAISQAFNKKQLLNTVTMFGTAALALLAANVIASGIDGFGLAMAAATGFTVGVWWAPDVYRTRSGSLALAMALIAGVWTAPAVVVLISLFGKIGG